MEEKNIESIIAKNLVELRKSRNLKQSDLSETIGYSDKTISRWENGSAIPDIATLVKISDFYGIDIGDLVKENAIAKSSEQAKIYQKEQNINAIVSLLLSVITVWAIAVVAYVMLQITRDVRLWQLFVWAVPVCALVCNSYNKRVFKIKIFGTVALSVAIWGAVTGVYFVFSEYNFWQLFILPVPIEGIIVLYTLFGYKEIKEQKKKRQKRLK